jgi:YARHG domain
MPHMGRFLVAAGLVLGGWATDAPARADCYEDIGCTDTDVFAQTDLRHLSCQNLWFVRNRIFDENGYCFKTARGRQAFDNSDCWVDDQEMVKLSTIERRNVEAIVKAETAKGCR